MILASAAGKARSEALARKCVEYLAHYSLSKTHKNCTVAYDKNTATIKVCEDSSAGAASIAEENGRTEVSFSDTGLNDWYRALNRAGYRTFMGGYELVLEEQVWYYLTPPLQPVRNGSTSESSSTSQQTSIGAITFMGENSSCTFQIIVNYNCAEE